MAKIWLALMHDKNFGRSLEERIEGLGVPVYSPKRVRLQPRKDRPSAQVYEVLLFPGYLFLYFDTSEIATTAITAFNGAYGFVRFGDQEPCRIPDSDIQKLKLAIKEYRNRLENPTVFSLREKSQDQTMSFLVRENSSAARCAGIHAFFKEICMRNQNAKKTKLLISY